ncbi:uncharacterized protein LOC135393540 [Ornithodoros turicata]|uniref:uncharacterized protein LOC135393540 n=1 Tax=Ornithodoros turicata TaxID=34597 RepID=UPI003139FCFD
MLDSDHTFISAVRLQGSRRRHDGAEEGGGIPPAHSPAYFLWFFLALLLMGLSMPIGFLILHLTRSARRPQDIASDVAATKNANRTSLVTLPRPLSLWMPPVRCGRPVSFFEPSAEQYKAFQKTVAAPGSGQHFQGDGAVFCYYNRSRLTILEGQAYRPFLIPSQFCSHVIYGPVPIDHSTLYLLTVTYDEMLLEDLETLRSSGAKLVVSVGGPEHDGTFSILANRTGFYSRLAVNLVSWIKEHKFSGVDLYWVDLDGPCGRADDTHALTRLVRHLRRAFAVNDPSLVITLHVPEAGRGQILNLTRGTVDYYFLPRSPCESTEFHGALRQMNQSIIDNLCFTLSPLGTAFSENTLEVVEAMLPYHVACQLNGTERFRDSCQAKLVLEGNSSVWHVYESPDTVAEKAREVRKMAPNNSCFLVSDVDMDDFLGSCGPKHALLQSVTMSGRR